MTKDADLRAQLLSIQDKQRALVEAHKALVGGWKRPDEFTMAEMDKMLKQAHDLNHAMREIFTKIKMRELEQGLANFRALLEQSFRDQGFEKDLPKVESLAKSHYLVIPETIQHISQNWHAKEATDADSKKVDAMEREYHLLLFDHDWLLRNSYRPIPDFTKMLKGLHSNRDSLNVWLTTPVVGNPAGGVLMESGAEATETTETEAEEPQAQAEQETSAETEVETEQETPVSFAETDASYANVDEYSFAEAEAEAARYAKKYGGQDAIFDQNIEGTEPPAAEQEADREFGVEVSYSALESEAQELDKMEEQFRKEGLVD